MIININQTITNLLYEDRTIKSSRTVEVYLLTPESGKYIRNKKTGETYMSTFSIGTRGKITDYEELDIPKETKSENE